MRQFLSKFALLSVPMIFLATLAFAQVKSVPITFTTTLTGANVVPPVETTGSGTVIAVLVGNELTVTGMYQGLGSTLQGGEVFGGARISVAPIGEEALITVEALTAEQGVHGSPPVMNLATTRGTSGTFSGVFTLSDEQLQALEDDLFYVQLYTLRNREGELRGQIITDVVLNLEAEDFVGIWYDYTYGGYLTHQYREDGGVVWRPLSSPAGVAEVPENPWRWEFEDNTVTWFSILPAESVAVGSCHGRYVYYPVLYEDGRVRYLLLESGPCSSPTDIWHEYHKVDVEGNRVPLR